MTTDQQKNEYFPRNVLASAGGELMWGLGLPVVVESTFLQVFLRQLGASSLVVGLIPTLFFTGIAIFGLISGYVNGHQQFKRTALIYTHLIAAVPILVFGIFLLLFGPGGHTLPLFLILYSCFSIGIGMTLPVWQNYLTKIFSDSKLFSAMSVIMFVQSAARLICSFLILGIVRAYSMDLGASGVIFITVGGVFLFGTGVYLLTKEVGDSPDAETNRKPFFQHLSSAWKTVLGHKNFLCYLASDIETFAAVGVISFYANYGVEHCGISTALASGLFVAFIYIGNLGVYLLFGWFNLLRLKAKFFVGKCCALAAVVLLLIFQSLPAFVLVSLLLGIARGTRSLAFPPAVKRISGMKDATLYFSSAPILVLPFSAGLPLISGLLLDRLGFLGGRSYLVIFGFFGLFILVSFFFLLKTEFPAEKPRKRRSKGG